MTNDKEASPPSPELPDLSRLSPAEVVSLLNSALCYSSKSRAVEIKEQADVIATHVNDYIEALPATDLPRAQDVYTRLATSPVDGERRDATVYLDFMTKVDREFGVELWRRLLTDPAWRVRDQALAILSNIQQEDDQARNLAAIGLSLEDAASLRASYEAAEAAQS